MVRSALIIPVIVRVIVDINLVLLRFIWSPILSAAHVRSVRNSAVLALVLVVSQSDYKIALISKNIAWNFDLLIPIGMSAQV